MQGDDIARVCVLLGQSGNAVTIEVEPNGLAQMLDAADIVGRQTFVVELRSDLPIPPAGIMLLGRQDHGAVGGGGGEIVVSPMGGKPTGYLRVVDLKDEQKLLVTVGAYHHG